MLIDEQDYSVVRALVEEMNLRVDQLMEDLCLTETTDIPTRMAFVTGQMNRLKSLLTFIKEIEDSLKEKEDQ